MAISKRKLLISAIAATVATITLTGAGMKLAKGQSLFQPLFKAPGLAFFQENPKEVIDEVWNIIDNDYVDGTFNQTDWRGVRTDYLNRTYPAKKEAYVAIREMLDKLGDPYTRFMDPDEFRNMKIDTSGELTGVGIQLSQDEKTKELIVVAPIEDTPAFKVGIQSRDIIVKITGRWARASR
jgi:carboxyl-terminal processing protease